MTRTEQVVNRNKEASELIKNAVIEGMPPEDIGAMVEAARAEALSDISVSLAMIVDLIGGKAND